MVAYNKILISIIGGYLSVLVLITFFSLKNYTGFTIDPDYLPYENITFVESNHFYQTRDNWPQVHTFLPFFVDLIFTWGFWKSWFIITTWEVFEVVCHLFLKNIILLNSFIDGMAEWFREPMLDSFIGDLCIGTVGIAISAMLRHTNKGFCEPWNRRQREGYKSKWFISQIITFLFLAMSNLLSIVFGILETPIKTKQFFVPRCKKNEIGVFPVGHILFFPIGCLLILISFWIDYESRFQRRTKEASVVVYSWIMLFFCFLWSATNMLLWLTYPSIILYVTLYVGLYLLHNKKKLLC